MPKTQRNTWAIHAALVALLLSAAPASAAEWIAGHYGPNGHFHPGHWTHGPDVWIAGHYGSGGYWHPGCWAGGYGPPPGPFEGPPGPPAYGYHWAPGFYGPQGGWHPGHWLPN